MKFFDKNCLFFYFLIVQKNKQGYRHGTNKVKRDSIHFNSKKSGDLFYKTSLHLKNLKK